VLTTNKEPHQKRDGLELLSILAVESIPDIEELVVTGLGSFGYKVSAEPDVRQGADVVARQTINIMLVEPQMVGGWSIEIFRRVKELRSVLPVVLVTGDRYDVAMEAHLAVADAVIDKPFDSSKIFVMLKRVLPRAVNW
jgi:two-component system OmpR family response regulator